MKKIVAVFLVFMMVALFAACGEDDTPPTSAALILTNVPATPSTSTQPSVSVTENVSANTNSNSSHTMILTTQHGQTVPTVVTTDFVPDPAVAQQESSSTAPNFEFVIPTGTTKPVVGTSALPTTTRKPTTTSQKTTSSQSSSSGQQNRQPSAKALDLESVSTLSDHQCELTFAPDGWGGGVKNKSTSISVVDSNGETKVVSARVAGKDSDGNYRIIIDTSNLDEGTCVFSLPAQLVESKDGLTYSRGDSVSANLSWDE